MSGFHKFYRLMQINFIIIRHGLHRSIIGNSSRSLRLLSYLNPWSFSANTSRGESIRRALEKLGPVFVKFGQLLSTRRDMLPDDIADELSKLQDQVPPFSGKIASQIIEKAYGSSLNSLFTHFDENSLASASIAQVHAATLPTGDDVIVKVLRPNIVKTIQSDIALMYSGARFARRFLRHGKRFKPVEVVAEFEHTIHNELDLLREASNASQLRRNFLDSDMMQVPKVYWDYARRNVIVMERVYGINISNLSALKNLKTDLKKLAEHGVKIFFTQVLRDGFFHADMHPGNLFVDVKDPKNPKYLGVDFGIMGTLSQRDQHYLAENLMAFFTRDYKEVALLHIRSGWVPADTRIDQFESAIRTVCEPIFEKPLKDISFGTLLLRLFQTADQFQMEIQPQFLLLQKTLLSIEGLGRQLYPELNLWETAHPLIEEWITQQRSLKTLFNNVMKDFTKSADVLMKIPVLLHDILSDMHYQQRMHHCNANRKVRKFSIRRLLFSFGLVSFLLGIVFFVKPYALPFTNLWFFTTLGLVLWVMGLAL